MTVTAKTGQTEAGKPEISAIIVPADTPGFIAEKAYDKLGWHASDTHPLSFTDVHVPEGNLLGERGRGFSQFLATLDDGRVAIAALAVGCIQACLDMSLQYASERQTFGAPIGRKQGLAFQISDLEVMLQASRLLVYKAAAMKDSMEDGRGASMKDFRQAAVGRQALRHRVRRHRHPDRHPGVRRVRLHGGVPRRAVLPRRQGARDRRGHLGGPADAHRAGARPARRVKSGETCARSVRPPYNLDPWESAGSGSLPR